jgi:hypothetical protein
MKRLLLGGPRHGEKVECGKDWEVICVRKPRDLLVRRTREELISLDTETATYICEDLVYQECVYLVARYENAQVPNAFILGNAPIRWRNSFDTCGSD